MFYLHSDYRVKTKDFRRLVPRLRANHLRIEDTQKRKLSLCNY